MAPPKFIFNIKCNGNNKLHVKGKNYIMRSLLLILMLSLLFAACEKKDLEKEFSAHYTGTFVRMRLPASPLEDPIVSNVTLHFTENTFNGTSSVVKYPAICSGKFTISQSKIQVENTCFFTAEFDWTFIFNGEYSYELNGDDLKIWRDYPNGYRDIYTLKKS